MPAAARREETTMADQPTTPTPPVPAVPATDQPQPTAPPAATEPRPTSTEPPAGFIPKEKYDETLGRLRAMEDTLRVLNPSRPPETPTQTNDPIALIAHQLNLQPDEARQWATFLTPFLNQMALPYVQALATLNDRYDQLHATTS